MEQEGRKWGLALPQLKFLLRYASLESAKVKGF